MTVNSSTTTYDVQELRRGFPGIDPELARFDGPGGSLVPGVVADAVAGSLRAGLCQRGGPTALGSSMPCVTSPSRDVHLSPSAEQVVTDWFTSARIVSSCGS